MGFHKDDTAIVVSGPATGQFVTVLGEGNVWDHTVQDENGKMFRLDPEQMIQVDPKMLDTMQVLIEHVRIDGFREGYHTGYTDATASSFNHFNGGN